MKGTSFSTKACVRTVPCRHGRHRHRATKTEPEPRPPSSLECWSGTDPGFQRKLNCCVFSSADGGPGPSPAGPRGRPGTPKRFSVCPARHDGGSGPVGPAGCGSNPDGYYGPTRGTTVVVLVPQGPGTLPPRSRGFRESATQQTLRSPIQQVRQAKPWPAGATVWRVCLPVLIFHSATPPRPEPVVIQARPTRIGPRLRVFARASRLPVDTYKPPNIIVPMRKDPGQNKRASIFQSFSKQQVDGLRGEPRRGRTGGGLRFDDAPPWGRGRKGDAAGKSFP